MKREREDDDDNRADGDVADDTAAAGNSAAKRQRPADGDGDAAPAPTPAVKEEPQEAARGVSPTSGAADEDEDDAVLVPRSSSRAAVKKGTECPYLDTISRQVCVDCGGTEAGPAATWVLPALAGQG